MRKPDAALMAARNKSQARQRVEAAEELVCLALVFAMIVLVLRIASVW